MKKLILSFGLLFCFSACLLASDGEVSDFNALQSTSTPVATPPLPLYRRQKPEIEFEVSDYSYKELVQKTPLRPNGQFMKFTGVMYGFSRENFNRGYLRDPFFTDSQIRFMFGFLDYDGCKKKDPKYDDYSIPYKEKWCPSFYLDTRKLVHYPIQVLDTHLELYPFSGLGYRLLWTYMGLRFSNYFYIPVGVTCKCQCKEGLSFDIRGEFDWMPLGLQLTGVIIPNIQLNGYGLGLSGKISKKIGNVEFSAGPFFRYWNIPKSNTFKLKIGEDKHMLLYEPKNYTQELGIKLGVSF
ncbi:hypothetical protein AGMMS49990_04270 [Endomicrobiia bacterium]|nr:hypothetical protein AGMMS49990_04270 [Endomicrobiia bacterium]